MRAAWWWIDRWRKSTAFTDMTAEQQGVYRNLLDELWLRDGVIPSEDRILSKISGDPEAWPRVREVVLARFRLTPEGYRNDTHDEVSAWPAAQAEKGRKRAANAARSGGRFTSPTSPTPAGRQPRPPAQHQPPSPSPSPSPLQQTTDSVAFAPGSLVPVVSVNASVVKASDSPLVKPVPASKQTWLTPFGDDWREAYGGEPSWGEMARVLKRPVDELGAAETRLRWRLYLGQVEGRFASPTRFAQTVGIWTEEAVARMQPRDIRSMTVGDFNNATLERMVKRFGEKLDGQRHEAVGSGPAETRRLLSDQAHRE